ncbi:MAG: hypothetical protein M1358_11045, partial [Chloroflexi bacterium]|nr:hypothetical protein [Chloroflexota bacterium]
VRLLKLAFDVSLCTSDAAYVVYPVVASGGALPPNPVPVNMAQHCAGAFGPILELIDRHSP